MKREYNIGLSILRAIMCFMVVLVHLWDATEARGIMRIFSQTRGFAVPVFMMMSFILVQPALVEHQKDKMKARFERLLIPQFGWAIIYWLVLFIVGRLFGSGLKRGLNDLLLQMFFGHCFNEPMWFQVSLIYLTLLFLVVILIFRKHYQFVLWLLCGCALYAQYSGINMVFDPLRYELKYPLGRFAEMLPIAVVGFAIASGNILDRLKKNKWTTVIVSLTVIGIDLNYGFFSAVAGYENAGVRGMVIAFAFIALFYVLPFEKMNEKLKKIIGFATSYTLGIYCLHHLMITLLYGAVTHFEIDFPVNSFGACIALYILCFVCAWIGTKITGKTKLKLLFN